MSDRNVVTYNFRDIPLDLWDRLKHAAIDERMSLRTLLLKIIEDYLGIIEK